MDSGRCLQLSDWSCDSWMLSTEEQPALYREVLHKYMANSTFRYSVGVTNLAWIEIVQISACLNKVKKKYFCHVNEQHLKKPRTGRWVGWVDS